MLVLRGHLLALGLVLVLGAAGCSGDSGSSDTRNVRASELKRFVPSPSDLPTGYELQEGANSTSAPDCGSDGLPPEALTKIKQLGFRGCASATFRKVVAEKSNGPGLLLIALASTDAASEALPELRKGFLDTVEMSLAARPSKRSTRQNIAVSGLGDESLPGTRITIDDGAATQLYFYFWRRGNVISFTGSSNALEDFSVRSTLELAKKIDARIAK